MLVFASTVIRLSSGGLEEESSETMLVSASSFDVQVLSIGPPLLLLHKISSLVVTMIFNRLEVLVFDSRHCRWMFCKSCLMSTANYALEMFLSSPTSSRDLDLIC